MENFITYERAIEMIQQAAPSACTEKVSVRQAAGRILAEPVFSPISQPPFPRSPLDGYAFHAEDSKGASKDTPVVLQVVDTIYAGEWCDKTIEHGQAVRLMTGAPIPAGCDCVLRYEDTDNGRDSVQLYVELKPWSNYCFAGEDFQAGAELLPAGTRLTGIALGALAAAGLDRDDEYVTVYKRLTCAIVCTGDELVGSDVRPLPPGKIYSSNETILRARIGELGMEALPEIGHGEDDVDRLAEVIRQAVAKADVVFTTGGVSVGDKDYVRAALEKIGAEMVFAGVRLKPGSPFMFSLVNGVPVLSLSGNPFAAYATFELFGRELLASMSGAWNLRPLVFQAVLASDFAKSSKGRRFIRGIFRDGAVTLPDGHSSGQLGSAALANCLVDIPAGSGPLHAGETVTVHLL